MEPLLPEKHFFNSFAQPILHSSSNGNIAVAHNNQLITLFDSELKVYSIMQNTLSDKPWSLKLKDNVLVRGGSQGSVHLWDLRDFKQIQPIHSFQKPGHKINALDLSQHFLAAGTSKGITFWDLRKMKQRCEFNQSFNEQLTGLQFSLEEPTVFHACSLDGLIARFDLKQPNEEDAFHWGHQILESPSRLQLVGETTLIQTQNKTIFTMEGQDIKQSFSVNNIQNPTHLLATTLGADKRVHYFTKTMKTNAVEYWIDSYNVGYLPTTVDIEMLIPIGDGKVIFADEKGSWQYGTVFAGVNGRSAVQNQNFMTVEQLQARNSKQKSQKVQKMVQSNGFILSKPSTLKEHSKKFRPF